ncbi:uncharacterized protein LAESUDRAFT_753704 [Laetiporus sulphureus 93-53]|uniref:F-box domain-containing protein n=1 Tax=Laetiporus sulphureus 93-53 TaxID=1314785 RepID=A0A165I679_9APHY|nr:uncharacterized protein LAESUDRAFT_753704 [Laetiporus sulphureus 93-53]KZT12646.1 hypothetical protein LAESUDRAFT_753704 [Laetiporus sulphureus 93-53]
MAVDSVDDSYARTRMPKEIPLDIVDIILRYLWTSPETYQNCTRVCREWYKLCAQQQARYNGIFLEDLSDLQALKRVCSSLTSAELYPKRRFLEVFEDERHPYSQQVPPVLSSDLPSLLHISFINSDWQTGRSPLSFNFFWGIAQFPYLSSVILYNCRFHTLSDLKKLVCAIRHLSILCLDKVVWVPAKTGGLQQTRDLQHPYESQIKTLRLTHLLSTRRASSSAVKDALTDPAFAELVPWIFGSVTDMFIHDCCFEDFNEFRSYVFAFSCVEKLFIERLELLSSPEGLGTMPPANSAVFLLPLIKPSPYGPGRFGVDYKFKRNMMWKWNGDEFHTEDTKALLEFQAGHWVPDDVNQLRILCQYESVTAPDLFGRKLEIYGGSPPEVMLLTGDRSFDELQFEIRRPVDIWSLDILWDSVAHALMQLRLWNCYELHIKLRFVALGELVIEAAGSPRFLHELKRLDTRLIRQALTQRTFNNLDRVYVEIMTWSTTEEMLDLVEEPLQDYVKRVMDLWDDRGILHVFVK